MRIVSLHYVRRRGGGEVEIAFEEGSSLTVDPDLSVQFQLQSGMDLSGGELERLKSAQEHLMARRRLVRYLSLRRKTAREAENYLRQLKFGAEAVEAAVKAAFEMGYLDDERFAEAFTVTQDRARKGPRAIRQELLQRGVEKELAHEAVSQLEDPQVQKERARAAAEKRADLLQRTEDDPRKARQKLMQFLLRRGFDGDVSAEVSRELLSDEAGQD